jgi:outer membrane biosynthesis protein TonB
MEFPMVKTPAAKTNGHTVSALKPAVPKKAAAAKKAAAKPAPKAPAKAAVKAAAKPAVKPAAKPAVKAAAKPAAKPAPKAAVKPAAKPAAAPAAKPARKAAAKPAAQAVPASAAKPAAVPEAEAGRDKVRKAKLVRDSFTMPEQEYAVLGQVKKACIKAGFEIKKSELLRIGVALISQLDMATLQNVLASLPQLKTGRPKND